MLQRGQKVHFSSQTRTVVKVEEHLQEGSFGKVFRCESVSGGKKFALKQTLLPSSSQLSQIENEVNLMYSVNALNVRVPHIVDFSVSCETGVLILMSLEPGFQLNEWLFQNGPNLPWTERIELAFALLINLAPTLKRLHSVLCHRDVNSHNILINISEKSKKLGFTLLDFGLAVERNAWDLYRWRDAAVSGDSRYWPCCAWRVFLDGWSSLTNKGISADQYREKLDMHSFALTLVETICANVPSGFSRILLLVTAWKAYWDHASRFGALFVECAKGQDDWDACKARITQLDVVKMTKSNLKLIRNALRSLRSQHQVFILIERMLCIDEFTVTADWGYICSKLNLGTTTLTTIASREPTPYQKESPLDFLRVHY